jgi:flavorubredoxin
MKALIVYDTKFGHTEKIAQAIGDALGGKVLPVEEGNPAELQEFSLVILGSSTHGGFPTEGINNLSNDAASLAGVETATGCWISSPTRPICRSYSRTHTLLASACGGLAPA